MSLKGNEPEQTSPPIGCDAAPDQVRTQLERILNSDSFSAARRLSAFLRFVVESALDGKEIKESLIGVEVYGRSPSYNPKEDSIVRAEASRLRSKLRDYYDHAGRADAVRIDLRKGSYVPTFQALAVPESLAIHSPPTEPTALHPPDSNSTRTSGEARHAPLAAFIGLAILGLLLPAFWIIRARIQTKPRTIALLAVRNTGPDASLNALAESWTSQLTKALLRSGAWRVAGPSPAVEPSNTDPAIGALRNYKADAVLSGTVRSLGHREVRINLDLINPADGYLLWHTSFDRTLLVANEGQQVAANAIIEELTRKYTGRPASPQSRSYALAREFWSSYNAAGLEKSIPHFLDVTRADPTFAPAWAGLADAYLRLAEDTTGQVETRDQVEVARRVAQKAISLDESNAEAHTVLGRIGLYHDWNFSSAAEHLQRSVALDPTRLLAVVSLSQALTIRGEMHSALEVIHEARARMPALAELVMQEGSVYFLAKRYEKMEEAGRELLHLEPENTLGRWLVGLSLEMRGRVREAISEYEAALRTLGREDGRLQCALSHAYGVAGEKERALAMMHRYYPDLDAPLTRFSLTYCVALVQASLGRRERALDWLVRSRQHQDMSFPFFRNDGRFDVLKSSPRYAELARSIER